MTRTLAVAAVLMLAGCTSQQMAATSAEATKISALTAQIELAAGTPDLVTLQKGCDAFNAEVAKTATVVNGGAKTTAGYVAAPGQAFCKIVSDGQVPANADANSLNWMDVLSMTLSTVRALAPIAAAVL